MPSEVQALLEAYPRIYLACHGRHVRDPEDGRRVSDHQASILAHLDPVDPAMVGELAEHLGVTASTMSLTLKRLEGAGYVRRDRDPADRRVMNVRLTEAGERMRDARSVLDPERVDRMLSAMDPDARRDALRGLRLLADAADAWVREEKRRFEAQLVGIRP